MRGEFAKLKGFGIEEAGYWFIGCGLIGYPGGNMRTSAILGLIFFVSIDAGNAQSIYKCTDKQGRVTYTSIPCQTKKQDVLHKETAAQANYRVYTNRINTLVALMNQQRFDEAMSYAASNNLTNEYNNLVNQYNTLHQRMTEGAIQASRQPPYQNNTDNTLERMLKQQDQDRMRQDIRDIKGRLDFGY